MDLYLMQHGNAVAGVDDPARPLTDEGRDAVGRVAERARVAGVRLDTCFHSGKLRAEQSAQLLAAAFGVGDVQAREGLAPNDPVAPTAQRLRELGPDDAVAVVGHLPFLGRLAALLITGDEDLEVIRFRMGGLVKLVRTDDVARFAVVWVLLPELA